MFRSGGGSSSESKKTPATIKKKTGPPQIGTLWHNQDGRASLYRLGWGGGGVEKTMAFTITPRGFVIFHAQKSVGCVSRT